MARKTKSTFNKKTFLAIVLPAMLGLLVLLGVVAYALYQPVMDNLATVRMALINAIDNINQPAPLDPRTGDAYFPETSLYVPRRDQPVQGFIYRYTPATADESWLLEITTRSVLDVQKNVLYTAQNSRQLFEKVSAAQACARAVALTDRPLRQLDGRKLHHQQQLGGRTLYFYTDPACPTPGAPAVIRALEQLQAY